MRWIIICLCLALGNLLWKLVSKNTTWEDFTVRTLFEFVAVLAVFVGKPWKS